MDAYPGYGAVPALEEGVQLLKATEFPPFEGIVLEIVTAALDDTLLLRMTRPTGKRDKAPVFGKSSVKLGDIGVIETGSGHTSLEIVQPDDTGHAAEVKEGILVGTHEGHLLLPPQRLFIAVTAAREYHPEYPGAPPLATIRVKGRWPLEEVHLRLLTRRVLHDGSHLRAAALEPADEAFYRVIAIAKVVIVLEVLPDALGTQPLVYCCLDDLTVRLTGTLRAGGHPGGI
jgi:hypothetical protein